MLRWLAPCENDRPVQRMSGVAIVTKRFRSWASVANHDRGPHCQRSESVRVGRGPVEHVRHRQGWDSVAAGGSPVCEEIMYCNIKGWGIRTDCYSNNNNKLIPSGWLFTFVPTVVVIHDKKGCFDVVFRAFIWTFSVTVWKQYY